MCQFLYVKIEIMTKNINDNYTTFAAKYDQLFDSDMYQDWLLYVREHTTATSVLDLGGGAGRLGVLLAEHQYQVTVLDLSPDMLSLAQMHANHADVDLTLLQADMREFSDWSTTYPLIVSFADALNYLPTIADLEAALFQVFDHLTDGGMFLFDVITPYQINVGYDNYYYNNDDDPENILMWTSFAGDEINSVDHDLKFFVYDETIDGFKIMREIHHEQTYNLATYQQLLQKVGFKNIEVSADFGRDEIHEDTTRWFFKAVKP